MTTERTAGRTPVKRALPIVSQALLTIVVIAYLFPFVWMIATALKPADEVFANPPSIVGSSLQFGNFAAALDYLPFGRQLLNSLIVSTIGAAIAVVVSIMGAYAFARLRFPGRDILFVVFLGTLMIPQEVVVIPMYTLLRGVGLQNSFPALILPWAFTAFGTFLLRQFFKNIPLEVEEAARLDGANRITILWRIVVPMSRPAIAVLGVFTFLGYWNSFLWPLIIVSDTQMATVPLGLQMFMGQSGNQWHLMMAAAAMAVVPMVLLVFALRRHLVSGIALSGLGGR